MNSDNRPVGVFDSGIGGISVLSELVTVLPHEDFVYYGDSKHAPYGTKTEQEILKLSEHCVDFLFKNNAKAIVIACNTATSIAAQVMRKKYSDIPIIGIEPAIKPAVYGMDNPNVLVMATPMTLKKEKFQSLMASYNDNAHIIPLPCPGLAELIEQGNFDGFELRDYLKQLLSPFKDAKINSVVLGCTHYPLIKDKIKAFFPANVHIFDGGRGTAEETKRRLCQCGICNSDEHTGIVTFQNSLNTQKEIDLCKKLLNKSIT